MKLSSRFCQQLFVKSWYPLGSQMSLLNLYYCTSGMSKPAALIAFSALFSLLRSEKVKIPHTLSERSSAYNFQIVSNTYSSSGPSLLSGDLHTRKTQSKVFIVPSIAETILWIFLSIQKPFVSPKPGTSIKLTQQGF